MSAEIFNSKNKRDPLRLNQTILITLPLIMLKIQETVGVIQIVTKYSYPQTIRQIPTQLLITVTYSKYPLRE